MAEMLGQRATRDVPDAKAYALSKAEVTATSEVLGKCLNPATGEPVTARREDTAVFPVKGSTTGSADGNGRGTCPFCSAHVALSSKGWVTSHTVRRTPVPTPPPAVRLVERQAEVTDTGARVGSPDASMRTRDAELRAAAGTATVKIKVKDVDGKTSEQEFPAVPASIRTALRQEQAKKNPDPKRLHKLGSMLRGATGTQAVPVKGAEPGTYKVREAVTLDAPNAPEGREERARHGERGHVPTSPGPALVNGGTMSCVPPEDADRETSKGKPRNAIGWSAPVGRLRPDRVVTQGDPALCKGKDCAIEGCVAIVGGRYGFLECHVFRGLNRTRKARYWNHVATSKRREQAFKEAARRPQREAAAEAKRLREVGKELPSRGW